MANGSAGQCRAGQCSAGQCRAGGRAGGRLPPNRKTRVYTSFSLQGLKVSGFRVSRFGVMGVCMFRVQGSGSQGLRVSGHVIPRTCPSGLGP